MTAQNCKTCGKMPVTKGYEGGYCSECLKIKKASEANRPEGYNTPAAKPTHTPGPWVERIKMEDESRPTWGIYSSSGIRVIETELGYYPPRLPDARLIAAAPELLEELMDMIRVQGFMSDAQEALLVKAGGISRAEGKS